MKHTWKEFLGYMKQGWIIECVILIIHMKSWLCIKRLNSGVITGHSVTMLLEIPAKSIGIPGLEAQS